VSIQRPLPRLSVPDLLARMDDRPGGGVWPAAVALSILGVVGFVAGLLADPARAWTALVWNWAFFSGLSMAGAVIVAAATAAGGRWAAPLRRIAEGLTAFLPVSYVVMIVLFFGLDHVYEWVEHPIAAKEAYLNVPFFVARQSVGTGLLFVLALIFVYWSLRPDVGRLRGRVTGWRRTLWDRLSRGWEGNDIEVEKAIRKRRTLAPALALAWAVLWSIWAFDWLMSIDPHWFSTMFAPWIFMTGFLCALAATAALACLVRPYGSFAETIDGRALHDIGKMVFAFTIFWTYLFFAQYLVIWYGRLPEETHWFDPRIWGAYRPVSTALFAAVFLVPFLGLLGVRPKKTPSTLTAFSVSSLLGLWALYLVLVGPGPFPESLPFGWIEIAIALGMLGVFATCYLFFMRAFPIVALEAGVAPDVEWEHAAERTDPNHHQA